MDSRKNQLSWVGLMTLCLLAYAGLYAPPEGPTLKIHPSKARFITSAEVNYFKFVEDDKGDVWGVIFSSGGTEVRLKKMQ